MYSSILAHSAPYGRVFDNAMVLSIIAAFDLGVPASSALEGELLGQHVQQLVLELLDFFTTYSVPESNEIRLETLTSRLVDA